MTTPPHEVLRAAREAAGYKHAKDFANAHGIPQPTYAMHEAGKRKMSLDVAARYSDLLDISDPAHLLRGKAIPIKHSLGRGKSVVIHELDVRADAGFGALETRMNEAEEPVVDEWTLPSDVLRAQTTAPQQELRIIRVYGDSMEPNLRPGDRVLVDTTDHLPSPPGIFVLWDGIGTVVKRVEHIPYSDPPRVRIASANPAYETYERELSEIAINGRVIGKWLWT